MESSRIYRLVMVLATCLVVSAASLGNRRDHINHLVSLFGKIHEFTRNKNTVHTPAKLDKFNSVEASPRSPASPDSGSFESFQNERSPDEDLFGRESGWVAKRQGGWSYDYGLGGGRFGKRNYGDYGIGGGRFGRDLDHVDLSDGNDAEMGL